MTCIISPDGQDERDEEVGRQLAAGDRARAPDAPAEVPEAPDALIEYGGDVGAAGRGRAPLRRSAGAVTRSCKAMMRPERPTYNTTAPRDCNSEIASGAPF